MARAIAGAKAKGRIVAEASTLALEDKLAFQRILAEAGHTALDCPMSGTGAQAAVKDLVVFASGDADADRQARRRRSPASRARCGTSGPTATAAR